MKTEQFPEGITGSQTRSKLNAMYRDVVILTRMSVASLLLSGAVFYMTLLRPDQKEPKSYQGVRAKQTTILELCMHCSEPIFQQESGTWVHMTYADGGYVSCADHKAKEYLGKGKPNAEPRATPNSIIMLPKVLKKETAQ